VDPEAGFVELAKLPLFDPELRGDADAVRRYRSWMRREEHAFLRVEAGRASIASREEAPRGTRGVVQRLVLTASRWDRPASIHVRVSGRLSRPALALINETPSSAARAASADEAKSRFKVREGTLRVSGTGANVIVQAWLRHGGETPQGSAERRADMRLAWEVLRRRMPTAVATIAWPEDAEEVHIDIACTFDSPAPVEPDWHMSARSPAPTQPPPGGTRDEPRPLLVPPRLVKPLRQMNRRAASYVRTCTALQVSATERCLLADHRILPLSWTRDAYWQARLLLSTWARGGHDDDARIVADHLRWLFLRCDRPGGRWRRSHEADGRPHDDRFAADEQLYPFLELADYVTATGSLPELPPELQWGSLIADAWAATEAALDAETGLLASDENAATDVPPYPYLLSDQVLLWHTATRLASLADRLGLARPPLAELAARTRAAVDSHFLVQGPHGQQWASSVDGHGGSELYLDATDLPVALAPLWGFCKSGAPPWRATLRFGLGPANPAWVEGAAGGLGSRHTPGTWTLGDILAWLAFGLMGERDASDAALSRLVAAAFTDGMLPEAYDPEGSGSAVRHWFAWPAAILGWLVLEHAAR
jgi:hypothetical protein